MTVLDEGSPEDFPKGVYESADELEEGVDYILGRIDLENERHLFNYGLNEIKGRDGSGGVTIESLLDKALKIRCREKRIENDSIYGEVLEEKRRKESSRDIIR